MHPPEPIDMKTVLDRLTTQTKARTTTKKKTTAKKKTATPKSLKKKHLGPRGEKEEKEEA